MRRRRNMMEEMLTGCQIFLAFPLQCDDEQSTREGCASFLVSLWRRLDLRDRRSDGLVSESTKRDYAPPFIVIFDFYFF